MKQDSLFELLLEERMDNALEVALSMNVCYKDSNKIIQKKHDKLEKTKLNKKQRLAVDRLLSAQNFNSSEYGRAAYRQGFKDCLLLAQELSRLVENI